MRIDKPMRGRKAAKRLDLSDLRHVLKDDRQWCGLGVVVAPTDGSPYWRIETDDNGDQIDVLVEVVLQPDQIPVTARLAAGLWVVPALDEEVAVVIPAGRVDFMPIIVGLLSSNIVPGGGQGPSPTRIVIARGEVLIHDGAGGAVPLALKSDVDDLRDYIANDLTLPVSGATAGPIASPLAPSSTGTTVLKAK